MASNYPFKINGQPLDGSGSDSVRLPAIKYQGASYSRQAVDSANTGRNQKGTMIRDMLGQKDKWQLEFVPCDQIAMKNILNLLDASSFQFTYPNPVGTGNVTKTFYCGDRSSPVFSITRTGTRIVGLWGGLSVDVIEM